jgi:hypothetical protein
MTAPTLLMLPLRLLVLALGLVMGFVLLLVGLLLAVALVVWTLLRGRPPQWRFQWVRPGAMRGAPFGAGRAAPIDDNVVDIEAREVPEPGAPSDKTLPPR